MSLFPSLSFHRVGGLYHWRAGPIGGSFYRAAKGGRKPPKAFEAPHATCITAFSDLPTKTRTFANRPVETVIDGLGIGLLVGGITGLLLFF